jgi:parvulin-like peptidyl-prolyl isomerase
MSSIPIIPMPNAQSENEGVLNPEPPTLTINHQPIAFKQVLQLLRSTGKLPLFLQELVSRYVIEQELQQRTDLEVDVSVLHQAIATFRQQNDLENPQQFQNWLIDQGWDETIFHKQVEFNFKLDTFKVQLAAPKLLETFIDHKFLLDQIVLSRIVVKTQDLAAELKIQIVEDAASFEQLAQDYSQTDDAVTNGMMGVLSRADVQNQFGIDAYQLQLGQVVGPIAHEQFWCLLRVEKILPAELDDSVDHYLQEQIFQQWLAKKVQALTIDLCLSDIA